MPLIWELLPTERYTLKKGSIEVEAGLGVDKILIDKKSYASAFGRRVVRE